MLEIKNININYKKKQILTDISFSADFGQCIGLLGINGSGKSSLLSSIAGAKKIYTGDIFFNDISLIKESDSYRKNIGYVTQENPLIDDLSALDNLRLWTSMSKNDLLNTLSNGPLSILNVQNFINIKVKKMSGGMKKRLSIASVLINNPHVLLLDEPFAALDMIAKHDIKTYINYYLKQGGIVIIASHEESIFDFCNKVYLLNNKSLIDTSLLPANISYVDLLRSSK